MRRYFVTGGTGFIGRELVRQLVSQDDTEMVVCLTRGLRTNRINHPKVLYWVGDIQNCPFPKRPFTDLIHGANEVNDLLQPDQLRYYYTIVEGTNRVLKWAATTGIQRTLILSSGAVARDTLYGHAKRQSEILASYYGENWSTVPGQRTEIKIARIFSVIGPEMPLNGQYAAGRFVGMALEGEIRYYGGTSLRSYLDVQDCARWLLHILGHARAGIPVDVAGDDSIHIGELAELTGTVFGVPVRKIDGPDRSDQYLPDLTLAKTLNLTQRITLTQSLERIHAHYKARPDLRHPNLEPSA